MTTPSSTSQSPRTKSFGSTTGSLGPFSDTHELAETGGPFITSELYRSPLRCWVRGHCSRDAVVVSAGCQGHAGKSGDERSQHRHGGEEGKQDSERRRFGSLIGNKHVGIFLGAGRLVGAARISGVGGSGRPAGVQSTVGKSMVVSLMRLKTLVKTVTAIARLMSTIWASV